MPRGRKPTGSVMFINGQWHVRVTAQDGSRPYFPMPGIPEGDYRRAKEFGAVVAAQYRSSACVPQASSETVNEWASGWFQHREANGIKWSSKSRCQFDKHIVPFFGTMPIVAVSRNDCERFVSTLDAKIATGQLAWKTAQNVWGLVTKMFKDCRKSKNTALRRREDNPTFEVEGPNRGPRRAKAWLYPDELVAVAHSPHVPVKWKVMIVLAVYTYMRRGELAALRRGDIDLAHGVMHIHSAEGEHGEVREIKTATQVKRGCVTRRPPIEPTLVPLLERLLANMADDDFVIDLPHESSMSLWLRKALRLAGVKRADLFANDRSRKNITWHDLRATGITWMAVRKDAPLAIQERAGHNRFETTELYVRTAESIRHGFGTPFPTLDLGLLMSADGITSQKRPSTKMEIANAAE